METIKIYEFKELSAKAQEKAKELMMPLFADIQGEGYWDDAHQTINKLKMAMGVDFDVNQSSQGFYLRGFSVNNYVANELEDDHDIFDALMEAFKAYFKAETWTDEMMVKQIGKVAYMPDRMPYIPFDLAICDFLQEVENTTNEVDETYFLEWMECQTTRFSESGRMVCL